MLPRFLRFGPQKQRPCGRNDKEEENSVRAASGRQRPLFVFEGGGRRKRSAEGGEVVGSDDLLAVGGVHNDGDVGKILDFGGVEGHDDGGAGHVGTARIGRDIVGMAMEIEGRNFRVAIKKAVREILPKIGGAEGVAVCSGGTVFGFLLDCIAISGGEINGDGDAKGVAKSAILLRGILSAVAESALAGKIHDFGVGSEKLDGGDPRPGFRRGKVLTIFLEELLSDFIVALAEEIGFANGFVGKGHVHGERRRRKKDCGREE